MQGKVSQSLLPAAEGGREEVEPALDDALLALVKEENLSRRSSVSKKSSQFLWPEFCRLVRMKRSRQQRLDLLVGLVENESIQL